MAKNKIEYTIGFKADASGLNSIKQSLNEIQRLSTVEFKAMNPTMGMEKAENELIRLKADAEKISTALTKAFNPKINSVSLKQFNQNLKNSKVDVNSVYATLNKLGQSDAFYKLVKQSLSMNLQLKETSHWANEIKTTLGNTIKWGVASRAMNEMSSSIQGAYNYVKALDSSLNDIRIVTGKSADEMERFAVQANKAAQKLGQGTKAYTDASLIYYQQGLGDNEVQARAETTLKAANVTGQDAKAVSEQLTAVWNGYKVDASEAEAYVDKLAAVASTTASNLEELSTGMSKVASAANAMGVDMDQLNAQLATIISVTRQAPETAGTALKTIYARMSSIKTGEDEDGTTLQKYTKDMKAMGINVLDQNNHIREMGDVIEEVGQKWSTMSKEQQLSLAQTMAGTRQYNNLLALFDNWGMYTDALETSADAAGTLQKQQDIYMESVEAHLEQAAAAAENFQDSLLDEGAIKNIADMGKELMNFLASFIDSLGGLQGVLITIAPLLLNMFGKNVAQSFANFGQNLKNAESNAKEWEKVQEEIQAGLQSKGYGSESIEKMLKQYENLYNRRHELSKEEYADIEKEILKYGDLLQELEKVKKARQEVADAYNETSNGKNKKPEELTSTDLSIVENRIRSHRRESREIFGEDRALEGYNNAVINSSTGRNRFEENSEDVQRVRNYINDSLLSRRDKSHFTKRERILVKDLEEMSEIDKREQELKNKVGNSEFSQEDLNRLRNLESQEERLRKVAKNANAKNKGKARKGQVAQDALDELQDLRDRSELENLKQRRVKIDRRIEKNRNKINSTVQAAGATTETVQENIQNFQQLEEQETNLTNSSKTLGQTFDYFKQDLQAVGAGAMQVMTGLASVGSAINSIQNIGRIFSNDDLSAGEKFAQIMMQLPVLITSAASSLQVFTGVKKVYEALTRKTTVTEGAEGAAKEKNALLTMLNTTVTIHDTEATIANHAVKVWWIAVLVAAAAAVIALATAIGSSLVDAYNADAKALEKAKKAQEELNNAYNSAKKELQDLKSEINAYTEAQKAIDELTAGTEEWYDAIKSANDQVTELLQKYPSLAKYISSSGGRLTISDEGFEELEKQKQTEADNLKRASLSATIITNKAQNKNDTTQLTRDIAGQHDSTRWGASLVTGDLLGGAISRGLEEFAYGNTLKYMQQDMSNGADFKEALDKFAGPFGPLRDALESNEAAIVKLQSEIDANTQANAALTIQMASSLVSDDANNKDLVAAIAGSNINARVQAKVEERNSEKGLADAWWNFLNIGGKIANKNKQDEYIKEFAKLQGWDPNKVSYDEGKATFKVDGVEQELKAGFDAIVTAVETDKATKEAESSMADLEEKIKELDLDESLGTSFAALAAGGDLDITSLTVESLTKLAGKEDLTDNAKKIFETLAEQAGIPIEEFTKKLTKGVEAYKKELDYIPENIKKANKNLTLEQLKNLDKFQDTLQIKAKNADFDITGILEKEFKDTDGSIASVLSDSWEILFSDTKEFTKKLVEAGKAEEEAKKITDKLKESFAALNNEVEGSLKNSQEYYKNTESLLKGKDNSSTFKTEDFEKAGIDEDLYKEFFQQARSGEWILREGKNLSDFQDKAYKEQHEKDVKISEIATGNFNDRIERGKFEIETTNEPIPMKDSSKSLKDIWNNIDFEGLKKSLNNDAEWEEITNILNNNMNNTLDSVIKDNNKITPEVAKYLGSVTQEFADGSAEKARQNYDRLINLGGIDNESKQELDTLVTDMDKATTSNEKYEKSLKINEKLSKILSDNKAVATEYFREEKDTGDYQALAGSSSMAAFEAVLASGRVTDVDAKILQEALNAEIAMQVNLLGTTRDEYELINEDIKEQTKGLNLDKTTLSEITLNTIKLEKGLNNIGKEWQNNYKALKDSLKGTVEYNETLIKIRDSMRQVFGQDIDTDFAEKYSEQFNNMLQNGFDENLYEQMVEEAALITANKFGLNLGNSFAELLASFNPIEHFLGEEVTGPALAKIQEMVEAAKDDKDKLEQIALLWEKIGINIDMVNLKAGKVTAVYEGMGDAARNTINQIAKQNKLAKGTLDLLEDEVDRYHDVNIQLKFIEKELDRLGKAQEKIFGPQIFNNLNKQLGVLKQQRDVLLEKQKIQQQEQVELQQELSGYGITFQADGTMANYLAQAQEWENQINALRTTAYNTQSDQDKQALAEAEKRYGKFKEKISRYDTLISDEMLDIEDQIAEIADMELDIELKKISVKVEAAIEIKDVNTALEDFNMAMMNNPGIDEVAKSIGRKIGFSISSETGELLNTSTLRQNLNALQEITQKYNDALKDPAADVTKLKDEMLNYYNAVIGDMEELKDLQRQIDEQYLAAMDETQAAFDRQKNIIESIGSSIEHTINVIKLTQGEGAYSAMASIYDARQTMDMETLTNATSQRNYWQDQMEKNKKYGIDSDEYKKAEEMFIAANQAWESAVTTTIEHLQEKYVNSINAIFENANNKLQNGLTSDYVDTEWDLMKKNADMYLDDVNRAYETRKLEAKYVDAINKSTSESAQKRINKLREEELKALREKDKLSQYDIDRANKKYDILLKEIALEEAQQNKSSMRLRRDSQGNYSYQFVADQDEISKAQQDLEDAKNNLYNFDREAYLKALEEARQIWNDYQQAMAEAAKINDPEERAKKELLIQKKYTLLLEAAVEKSEETKKNFKATATEEVKTLLGEEATAVGKVEEAVNKLSPAFTSSAQAWVDAVNKEDGGVKGVMDDLYTFIEQENKDYITDMDKVKTAAGGTFITIANNANIATSAIGKAKDEIDALTKKISDPKDGLIAKVGALKDAFKDAFEGLFGENGTLKTEIDSALGAVTKTIDDVNTAIINAKAAAEAASQIPPPKGSDTTDDVNGTGIRPPEKLPEKTYKYEDIFAELRSKVLTIDPDKYKTKLTSGDIVEALLGKAKRTTYDSIKSTSDQNIYWRQNVDPELSKLTEAVTKEEVEKKFEMRETQIKGTKYTRINVGGQLYYLTEKERKEIFGFATGGYTGDWAGTEGKLAMLHQKELVLNANDTENLLAAVSELRKTKLQLDSNYLQDKLEYMLQKISFATSASELNAKYSSLGGDLQQKVEISASFPNATNHTEIEEAFKNLTNTALQYAYSTDQ